MIAVPAMYRRLLPVLVNIGPAAFRKFVVEHHPSEPVQRVRKIIDVMDSNARRIVSEKLEAVRTGDESKFNEFDGGKDILSRLGASPPPPSRR